MFSFFLARGGSINDCHWYVYSTEERLDKTEGSDNGGQTWTRECLLAAATVGQGKGEGGNLKKEKKKRKRRSHWCGGLGFLTRRVDRDDLGPSPMAKRRAYAAARAQEKKVLRKLS